MSRVVDTERLRLRPFTLDDFDDFHAYQSHPAVTRYLHWEPRDADQTRTALDTVCGETSLDVVGDWLTFAVVPRAFDRVIGEVGLKLLDRSNPRHPQGETGFVFHPDFQGQGYAAEAAGAMLALAFDQFGWHRVIGCCNSGNAASVRLMRRLGMRCEAHFVRNTWFKGEWQDELVYAIRAEEWRGD